jgi:hypothetical protein
VDYDVEPAGAALQALVDGVDRIAEIPDSMRSGTAVRLRAAHLESTSAPPPRGR